MTATLNDSTWNFTPCPECVDGTRTISVGTRTKDQPRDVLLWFRKCSGRGYLRTKDPRNWK